VMELNGVIDLHVHAGPDVRPRKMTALELAGAARVARMGGLLLKNHHTSTVLQAAAVSEQLPGLKVLGGLALNEWVGGWNPAAVEAALRMGAAEIWMPTLSSENEHAHRGHPGTGLSIHGGDGRLLPAISEILRMIAEHEAILGTGHLSPGEIVAVVKAGREAGVRKFLITHPEIKFVNLPIATQRELVGPDLWFERCFARPGLFVLDWDELAAAIREVGVATTVLATDLGQPENPDPVSGMRQMLGELGRRGFTQRELETMACRNPAILLGLS
jgi:hypothetical protein